MFFMKVQQNVDHLESSIVIKLPRTTHGAQDRDCASWPLKFVKEN